MQENRGLIWAVGCLPEGCQRAILSLERDALQGIEEVRLRSGMPLGLTMVGGYGLTDVSVTQQEVEETFMRLCRNSVFAHEQEIRQGFISLPLGLRAGVCGEFDEWGNLCHISSINIRIARQIIGCADGILSGFCGGGMLIAGPPCSGKTTVLREAVRCLSNGKTGRTYKVAVIDSRGEISGGGACDLGPNTDILKMHDKALGAQMALRTLFPDVIAFDEIGRTQELTSVAESFNAGVSVLLTAHAGSFEDLNSRAVTRALLGGGAIKNVVFLEGVGKTPICKPVEEVLGYVTH